VRAPVDIEDLAQETYIRLLRNQDLSEVNNPQAYLLRVAGHVVTEWRNEQPPEDALSELSENELIDGFDLEGDLDAQIKQARLEQILSGATPAVRSVVLLRFRDGRSRKDIAEELAMTERQVRRHLIRGYEYLRGFLQELNGVDLND
jgi:RNA polymerase sigma-70 factor (ECF subfamily)